ncbi:MAG: enoyl-CoA hydratase [SAR324 cluster bacterium]|nr:enoyl-CoA hydratase [SAR324 cluster bacterium]
MSETTEDLRVNVESKVATLTFNRPQKMNSLSADLIESTISNLKEFAVDSSIGAIVLTGEGDRAFCAGGDVSKMADSSGTPLTFEQAIDRQRKGQELSRLLHVIPKVTIAAVNGYAVGAGLGIALSCDLRFCSEHAKFGTAFAKVGYGGDYGTTWQLTRLVGEAKAKELFILGDIVDSNEALRIGLVNRVIPKDEFAETIKELASRIAHGPLVSFRYMKENINLAVNSDFHTILDRESITHLRCGQTQDHREGVAAFMEKRDPVFQGR